MPKKPTTVLDARALDRTLRRMADQIVELNAGTDNLVIVGIQRRGVQLAERIVRIIEAQEKVQVASGALDITLYRDDLQTVGPRPVVGATSLPWALDDQRVVIVDDVL
ncbi:phosphoribosyltransferase family protein [Gemmatimonas sp.]